MKKLPKSPKKRPSKVSRTLKKASKSAKRPTKKVLRKPMTGKSLHIFLSRVLSPEKETVTSGNPSVASSSNGFELPAAYGEDRATLLVRDPWWLYAYWEVTPDTYQKTLARLERDGNTFEKTVLRVYDITEAAAGGSKSFFDIELNFFADNWTIDVGVPDREWVIEIGLRTRTGGFYTLVRSNTAHTPRYGISDVIDEEWMLPDDLYWKIFGLSGGLGANKSSLDVRAFLEKYLRNLGSSENAARAPVLEKK